MTAPPQLSLPTPQALPGPARTARGPSLAFLIPSKNRHGPLARTLVLAARAADAAGAGLLICDQSPAPFPASGSWTVLHRPDLNGLPAARNALLAATGADMVCFLDDDTDLAADFGLVLRRLAVSEPDFASWGPVCEVRGPRTRRLHRLAQFGCFRDPRRLLARRCDRRTTALFGCCFAVRRSAALAIGGFDARRPGYALGEDLDFCFRLAAAGHRLRFCSDLRAWHRRDGADRDDPWKRGRRKAAFLRWLAQRHGGGNPATPLHLALALAAAAAGGGQEPAGWAGVLAGLLRDG